MTRHDLTIRDGRNPPLMLSTTAHNTYIPGHSSTRSSLPRRPFHFLYCFGGNLRRTPPTFSRRFSLLCVCARFFFALLERFFFGLFAFRPLGVNLLKTFIRLLFSTSDPLLNAYRVFVQAGKNVCNLTKTYIFDWCRRVFRIECFCSFEACLW